MHRSSEKSLAVLLLSILLLSCCAALAYGLTSADIVGTQPEGYGQKPNACELHVEFKYRLPDDPDPTKWTLADLLTSPAEIDNFLKRIIEVQIERQASSPVYLHAFSSYEGGVATNEEIARRRADAMRRLVNERLQALKQQYPADVVDVVGDLSSGTVKWKIDTFWKLSNSEKKAINAYYGTNPTLQERTAIFEANQALRENRRAILTFGTSEFSLVPVSTGFFDTGGCPQPKPVCGNNRVETGETCDPPDIECGTGMVCDATCQCVAACGNNKIDPGEACDPPGSACGTGLVCDESCTQCVPEEVTPPTPLPPPTPPPTPPGKVCEKDGKKASNEECDPTATPTGCPSGQMCSQQCSCYAEGVGAPPEEEGWFKWWYLLFLIPLLFWIYRTRRTHSKQRQAAAGEQFGNKKEICIFLAALLQKKKELIQSIKEIEEKIDKLSPTLKEDLKKYFANFRDVAYLTDRTSQESQMLDRAGGEIKEIFEDYMQLVIDLLELEKLEATLLNVLETLKKGIGETKTTGTSQTLASLGITLDPAEMDELDTKVIPKLEKEARDILKEASLIELTIEQHVRELGFSLSGIVSILGKGKWEKKFKARYGAYGDEAYKELWWVKKKLKYHAPIYLRDELKEGKSWLFKRTGERHIWPFNKLKWEKDREVSTAEGTPEDQRWRERAKDLWGKDITAKSAYLKKLGERIFASIEKDKHLISSLYQKTVTGGMATDGGRLKEEADSLQRMAEVICAKKPQFSVKIQAPKSWKIAASKLEQLLKSTAPFKAKITGGTPQYGYIWHWGPTLGNPLDPPHIQVGSNLVLTGTPGKTDFTQTGTGGKSTDIVMAGGFSELASRAASSTPPKPPFDLSYSAGGNATTFYLHVIAIDGRGAMANDYIALELKGAAPPPPPPEQAIEGTVVDAENPDRKIEGARVWATHYPVKGGKQEEAKDKDGKVIEAFSDREGRFTLRGDFKFDVIVYAKKDKTGGAHVDRGGKPAGRPFDCPSPEMKDVVVPIRFTEITHSVISGRVINAATYDPEHPENAEGVEGATVWLTHPGVFMGFTELKKDGKRVETISGKDGRFRFENLRIPPLKIRVGAEKEIEVGAEKKKVSGRSTDPAELGAVPGNDVLIDCPPGSDKVAVPLEMLPRALVVPADNAKPHGFEELKNHTLQYGTHHPPVKAYPGQVIAKHGAPPLAPEQYISAEVDFFLLKERGKRELNWLFDIEHESGERVSDFTAWGFEVAVTGVPEDRHNPYEYKKSSKYNKFTPPEGWVEEHKNSVAFHPYFKIPMDAKPGKYRLILRIADKDLKEVDYNYVELEIKGPVTPAAKPPFEVPPSMTKDIKDNLDKIALIVQGKIGADKELPADMRGIGNHVVEIVAQMIAEIETHNLVVAMKGAMKYRHNPKPSTPRGLNNFEEKRFFGYLQDGRMTIVSMEKFVFGSGKPMEIDTSGKGWMFKTKGMGLDWLVKALLAGNVGAAAEIVKLIDEKKKRFTEYTEKLKEAESKIDVKIHEAYANNDEQLLTLYEKMKACLTNIRQYMESHRVTEGLDVLKMYLGESRDRLMKYIESWRTSSEGSDSLEGWDYRVTGARRREIEELMRKMLGDEKKKELRELKGAALDAELKKLNAQVKAEVERFFSEHRLGLIQAVDEIVAALTKHINELRMQIYSMLPVIERNYAELDKDVKQFNELMRSRAQAGSEIRAA